MAEKTRHIAFAISKCLKKKYLDNRYNVRSAVVLSQNFCAFLRASMCGIVCYSYFFCYFVMLFSCTVSFSILFLASHK